MTNDPNAPGARRAVYDDGDPTENTYGTPENPDIGSPRRRAGGPARGSSMRSWLAVLAVVVLGLIVLGYFSGWGDGWMVGTTDLGVDATPNVSADVSPADPGDPAPAAPAD